MYSINVSQKTTNIMYFAELLTMSQIKRGPVPVRLSKTSMILADLLHSKVIALEKTRAMARRHIIPFLMLQLREDSTASHAFSIACERSASNSNNSLWNSVVLRMATTFLDGY